MYILKIVKESLEVRKFKMVINLIGLYVDVIYCKMMSHNMMQ